jgi:hypothetical protein
MIIGNVHVLLHQEETSLNGELFSERQPVLMFSYLESILRGSERRQYGIPVYILFLSSEDRYCAGGQIFR